MSSVYTVITDRILASLEAGVCPWRTSWSSNLPTNMISGRSYRGVNRLLLASTSYESPYWLTFNQARGLKGSIRRGEKGMPIIFWQIRDSKDADGKAKRDFILRFFTVFNIAQTERIEIPQPKASKPFDPIERCEAIVAGYQGAPRIDHGGDRAAYSPLEDRVLMPGREAFDSESDYYSTLFHELSHSTGASHRLNRKGVVDPIRYSSHGYAFEELIAEIGSAFLCADAGIAPAVLDASASYIAEWLKRLSTEPRWIIDASAQAERATEFILGREARDETTEVAAA